MPPKYEIKFTDEVKEEEELAIFISEKRNISIDSAKFYITDFVENIHSQLADKQQADFNHIGQIKRINDQISLEFFAPIDVDHTFFGLPNVNESQTAELRTHNNLVDEGSILNKEKETDNQPVFDEISEINDIQANNEREERVDIDPYATPDEFYHEQTSGVEIEKLDVEENKDAANVTEQSEEQPITSDILDPLWKPTVISRYEYDEEEEEQTSRWPKTLFKIILTLVIIAAFAFAVMYFLYPNLLQRIIDRPFEQPKIEAPGGGGGGTVKVDTSSDTEKKIAITQDTVKKNVVFTSLAKDSLKKPNKNEIVYEVIGSAMKTQKKVDEVISNFAKRGIVAKQMDAMPGRLIKISLGTFTNYNFAKEFQDSLKIKLRNPEIYIQTIKPKN